jgi:hypothetical protein
MATGVINLPIDGGVGDAATPARRRFFNSKPALSFNPTGILYQHYTFRMPEDYASGLEVVVQYKMPTATSGSVVLGAQLMAATPGDAIGADSYATANTVTDAVPGTVELLAEAAITMTNDDGVAAGDWCALRVFRDGDNGSDDAAGLCDVVGLAVQYTTV